MRVGAALAILAAGALGFTSAKPAARVPLAVAVAGKGKVRSSPKGIACPPRCRARFRKGTKVKLTARPAAAWKFERWTGACKSKTSRCALRLTRSRRVRAVFSMPPPAPPPPGFSPQLIAGSWQGSWTNTQFNTAGAASIVVTLPTSNSFRFEATFGGTVFGCGQQPAISATVTEGTGPNHWNPGGFSIDFTNQNSGTVRLTHDYNLRTLDGTGSPGCRPTVSWVLTGAFDTNYTTFNGSVTTTLEDGTSSPALISLAKQ